MKNARFEKLRRNKFLLFACVFFMQLNALQAIIQLFYLNRGLDVSQIFYLGIAWSVASLVFDIPTSYLADKWGRKNTLILGIFVNIIANFLVFYSYGFMAFVINTFILSASFSFFSGVEDAFMYDNLKEMKQEGVVLKTSGKYAIASKLSKMFTPLLGVLIAKELLSSQFDILLGINFVSSCLAIVFSFFLVEPKREINLSNNYIEQLKSGLIILKNNHLLQTIALNKSILFIASFMFWKFYQVILHNAGITVLALGIIYVLHNLIIIFVFSRTSIIFQKINKVAIFEFPIWLTLIGSTFFWITNKPWFMYILSVAIIITGIIRDPFFNQQIQWRIRSENRATITSMILFVKSILDIPVFLISGYIANFGVKNIMVVPIILSLIIIVFFRIKKEDILIAPS